MEHITRRELLAGGAAFLGASAIKASPGARLSSLEVGKVDPVGGSSYFHEGNIAEGNCNNGWVILEDYVLVIDASFPRSVDALLPKIRALTDKPIRFAFDTHHHGDHAYGNQKMVDAGAVPLAHTGVIEEMKRYETGYYGGKPGRWEGAAKERADLRDTRLKPPSVLFPRDLIFDDGKHRVELIHLGVAHTHGDAVAWVPSERILFTGDVCVNGPFNFVGDGNVEEWIGTLDAAMKLGARIVCPGHGPRAEAALLGQQQSFFKQLREQVGALVNGKKSAQEIHDSVDQISAALKSDAAISRYVGGRQGLTSQVEKVYTEMTGEHFPAAGNTSGAARERHAQAHGLPLIA